MIRQATDKALDLLAGRVSAGEQWLLGARRASYGVAAVRVIFGLAALWFLAANWSNRHYLWGDAGQWMSPLDRNGGFGWPFTLFAGGSGQTELTLKLLVVFALAAAFTLGWRTRVVAPLLLICWVSLIESNPLYGDQSDNIFRILLIYLCFADLSGRWSLDARRRTRIARGERRPLVAVPARWRANATLLGTLLHNLAVLAVAIQICIIYVASAMYKIQGESWQDGTAVYYPLQVGQYRPWPWLADVLSANAFGVLVVTYFSVFIQLFFPLLLLRRATRVIAIVGVLAMHVGIGVVMGLPFFSLFIMAGDQIFIRDQTYAAISRRVRRELRTRWPKAAQRLAKPAPTTATAPASASAPAGSDTAQLEPTTSTPGPAASGEPASTPEPATPASESTTPEPAEPVSSR